MSRVVLKRYDLQQAVLWIPLAGVYCKGQIVGHHHGSIDGPCYGIYKCQGYNSTVPLIQVTASPPTQTWPVAS